MSKCQRRTSRHPDKWRQRSAMRGLIRWQREQQALRDVSLVLDVLRDKMPDFFGVLESLGVPSYVMVSRMRGIL